MPAAGVEVRLASGTEKTEATRRSEGVWRRLDDPAFVSLSLFLTGLLLLLSLEVYGSAYGRGAQYLQFHSSEDMMQTLSLLDLQERPWQSLLVLHVQPPLLDALRALLAQLWPDLGKRALVLQVDRALYLVWAVGYAGIGVLVFRWLARLLGSTRPAALAALGFLLHPGAIYYGSYLDSTTLTTLGLLVLSYALWTVPARGALLLLGGAYVFLFLLRSIFQWPILVVLIASLLLMRVPARRVAAFALLCGLVVGAYTLKQYLVFGSTGTSSLAGSNCLHGLGEEPEVGVAARMSVPLGPLLAGRSFEEYPSALTRATKITGAHNFNHVADLFNERHLAQRCVRQILSQPLTTTLRAYAVNLGFFLRPSSQYYEQPHALVDRLPWRGAYDWVFSGSRLLILLTAAVLLWARRRTRADLLRGLGLALPLLVVTAASVIFERGENMRFRYFTEPVVFVFLVSVLGTGLRRRRKA